MDRYDAQTDIPADPSGRSEVRSFLCSPHRLNRTALFAVSGCGSCFWRRRGVSSCSMTAAGQTETVSACCLVVLLMLQLLIHLSTYLTGLVKGWPPVQRTSREVSVWHRLLSLSVVCLWSGAWLHLLWTGGLGRWLGGATITAFLLSPFFGGLDSVELKNFRSFRRN